MTLGAERSSVQDPLLQYVQNLGWSYLDAEEAVRLRHGEAGLLLHGVFRDQLEKLNAPWITIDAIEQVQRRLSTVKPTIEGNQSAWEWQRGLKTAFDRVEKRDRDVILLHPDHARNVYHVTDELTYDHGTPPRIRLDVCFFINGVPVLFVETKAAKLKDGIPKAIDQVRAYHRDGPELLALIQLFSVTHLVQYYYGATWNVSRKGLFNWREESEGGTFEDLVKGFLAPERVLKAITEYLLFTRVDGELSKVVLRPHQMRATEKVVERAADPSKRRGLVWHTQGSGKTYTMITVARRLVEDARFGHPTVLMLVDRNELEEQLFSNLGAVGFVREDIEARSMDHLRELLASDRRGLIVSTIHKFDKMPAAMTERSNVIVLVDEAHRTTAGDLGNYLVGALPNATFIGFTGTPVDRTAHGKGTFKVFAQDDPKGYVDKYSIKESIRDGTTVPLHYALAPNELLVDRETLEREFLANAEAEGMADVEDLNRVLQRAVNLQNMLKSTHRFEQVARHVADHFTHTVEPMGYKALLVCVDREACTLYKAALDTLLPPAYSDVIMSPAQHDSPALRRFHYDRQQEEDVRKAFRKSDTTPKILIVTDKLLTGFDAPILYCMYLDKPMRDHVLLQAIARVNRPYEDADGRRKPAGFVLDYVGIFDKLEKALAFDAKDVSGVIEGLDVLQVSFTRQMATARERYFPIVSGLHGDKQVEAVLEAFRDHEVRLAFYEFFDQIQETYEVLSPDPFLRAFLDDYGLLVSMYEVCRANYDRGVDVDRSFLRKTGALVREHTFSGGIEAPGKVFELTEGALRELAEEPSPANVKVFNLLKALHQEVEKSAQEQPFLISIGERAEEIARQFEERQIETEQALLLLLNLAKDAQEGREAQQAIGLPPDGFAVFWYLKGKGLPDEKARSIADAAATTFAAHPHWRASGEQLRAVRLGLYGALIHAGYQTESVALVGEMLDQLLRVR
jgi:type I restriction enzyme R subunit